MSIQDASTFVHCTNVAINIFVHISSITVDFYFWGMNYQEIVGDFWAKEYVHFLIKFIFNNKQQFKISPKNIVEASFPPHTH